MTSALVIDRQSVIELRQYTLRRGRREALIELFERELLEPQDEVGMRVLGQFRDLDRPDRFVWLRGFPDLAARAGALAAFYDGPVWREHRDAANATMLDSDDVLLLRPVGSGADFPASGAGRPTADGSEPCSVVTAAVHLLRQPVDAAFLGWYTAEVEPILQRAGSPRLALLETEPAPNSFPRLPVREGEFAVVRFSRFRDQATWDAVRRRIGHDPEWAVVVSRLEEHLVAPPVILRLQPTQRSSLR